MKGKKVGVTFASSAHLLVLNLLDQAGLKADKDDRAERARAGNAGRVPVRPDRCGGGLDAAVHAISAMPGARVLADDTQFSLYRDYGVTPGPDVLVARRAFLEKTRTR